MFFRTKTSGSRSYLQIVENRWEGGRTRQRVIATLGRLDQLQQDGRLDALLTSGARLSQSILLLSAHAKGQLPTITTRRIGPALVSQRLWQHTGCQRVIEQLLEGRRFEFDVERAVFLTVLHRLFAPGSDRAADKWRTGYQIDGCDALRLHHLYRAMAWLGEELPLGMGREQQDGLSQTSARDQEGVKLSGLLQLIESPQGGDDPLPWSSVLPTVLDDLEVGTSSGGLGSEEHGALVVGTP